MHPILEKYQEIMEYEFKNTFKYADNFENVRAYKISYDGLNKMIKGKKNSSIYKWDFLWLYEIGMFHYEHSIYSLIKSKDEVLVKKHLSFALEYAYYGIKYASLTCGEYEEGNPFLIVNKAIFTQSILLLSNQYERYESLGKHFIDSLNGQNCIIKRGYAKSTISYFLLKLFSLYIKQDITLHKLLQAQIQYPYDEIINNWNTNNLIDIEIYITFLCEEHIKCAELNWEQYREEDDESLAYKELFLVSSYSFPYEVLVLLKLREKLGLENPKKFTHPLMNTPISKFFLNLKEPLVRPRIDEIEELSLIAYEKFSNIKFEI
jgi:hypothetical protein